VQVAAVVSQPGKPRGRGNKSTPLPTPVEEEALRSGIGPSQILCPASAKDPAFLEALQALAPDLCITAAYGNMLPQRFLDIPRLGTLNVHPSLLPKWVVD
jgi:methionyl-tRNA formyltransferase